METKQLDDYIVVGQYYLHTRYNDKSVWKVLDKRVVNDALLEVKFAHSPWDYPDSFAFIPNPKKDDFISLTEEEVLLWKLSN